MARVADRRTLWRLISRNASRHLPTKPSRSSDASCSTFCRKASAASVITACSLALPARLTSNTPANCSGSLHPWPKTRRSNPRMHARHAHAAGDACSSSKPLNAGPSPGHRRQPPTQPGPPRHDPAWLTCILPRGQCASGKDHAHARAPATSAMSHPPRGPTRYQRLTSPPVVSTAPTRTFAAGCPARRSSTRKPKTHRSASVARGFLLWRISYTCRCPISFTVSEIPRPDGESGPRSRSC
jgi:hypothetical protein